MGMKSKNTKKSDPAVTRSSTFVDMDRRFRGKGGAMRHRTAPRGGAKKANHFEGW